MRCVQYETEQGLIIMMVTRVIKYHTLIVMAGSGSPEI